MQVVSSSDDSLVYSFEKLVESGQLYNFKLLMNNQELIDTKVTHNNKASYIVAPLSLHHKNILEPYFAKSLPLLMLKYLQLVNEAGSTVIDTKAGDLLREL